MEKTICCSSKQIQMKAWVDRTVYVSGETITFDGVAQVLGNGKMRHTTVTLYQVRTCTFHD